MKNNILRYVLIPSVLILMFDFYFAFKANFPFWYFLSSIILSFQLILVVICCLYGVKLAKNNHSKKGSNFLFGLNIIAVFVSLILSDLLGKFLMYYKFYFNDWMINIGGKPFNYNHLIDFKVLLFLIVPIITFYVFKKYWKSQKKYRHR